MACGYVKCAWRWSQCGDPDVGKSRGASHQHGVDGSMSNGDLYGAWKDFVQSDDRAWVVLAERIHRLAANCIADCRGQAQTDSARQPVGDRSGLSERGVGGGNRIGTLGQQDSAGGRQRHTMGGAVEQFDTKLGFELCHVPRHHLLREVKPLCGSCEVELLGHDDERTQPAQIRHVDGPGGDGVESHVIGVSQSATRSPSSSS